MHRRHLIALALSLAGLVALPATAQDKHWLVGTWKGELGNNFKGKSGTSRTMLIQSVAPNGTVTGGWAAAKNPRVGNADFKLTGDTLMVTTDADSQVELKRMSDGRLRGQFRDMKGGKTYPIDMTRE